MACSFNLCSLLSVFLFLVFRLTLSRAWLSLCSITTYFYYYWYVFSFSLYRLTFFDITFSDNVSFCYLLFDTAGHPTKNFMDAFHYIIILMTLLRLCIPHSLLIPFTFWKGHVVNLPCIKFRPFITHASITIYTKCCIVWHCSWYTFISWNTDTC